MASGSGQAVVVAADFGAVRSDDGEPTSDGLDLRDFENLPARDVPVETLSPDLCVRQGGTNAAHVQLLVDVPVVAQLPPILVQENGLRVIDGLHRLEAAKLRGDRIVRARFVDCTDSEALVLAMKANSSHGLPLSKADRISGAQRVLAAHPDWSDRAIARIAGVSAKTIASLRCQSMGECEPDGKRLGRDGKRRPVTPGEGRRRAAEYIVAHPNAPLRQVAKASGVSLGTVHDVRSRLRRGANPELNGYRTPVEHPTAEAGETGDSDPAINGATLRRKNHTERPPTWTQIAAKIANDPTIRYTEGGKKFLRWMSLHAADPHRWREFISTIPSHWHPVIAPMADRISREWALFAQQLNRQ